jgi:hypothetical protein
MDINVLRSCVELGILTLRSLLGCPRRSQLSSVPGLPASASLYSFNSSWRSVHNQAASFVALVCPMYYASYEDKATAIPHRAPVPRLSTYPNVNFRLQISRPIRVGVTKKGLQLSLEHQFQIFYPLRYRKIGFPMYRLQRERRQRQCLVSSQAKRPEQLN